ncbi:MAG: FprA family A-type flavoprotein [Elusimicrobiota bacterium]|jgi:flavorubredoxin|nr:FprA family A-type flavoprotein [Elusimicrobiota bacterium]
MVTKIIKDNVFAVGAVDWNERRFHGYSYVTKRGVTYNSYLIVDDQTTLLDTVRVGFEKEWIENITNISELSKIKNIIINHIEPDHSGGFPEIVKLCPNAVFYGTEKAKAGLFKYYGVLPKNWISVKFGQNLNIGKRTLEFIDVPMIHWPDSMFTYCAYDKILFSNDGFGQHYATNKTFDDEVCFGDLMDEVQKYYANILWPFSSIIKAKLEAIIKLKLPIEIIAPSHGLVWKKYVNEVIEKYLYWSNSSCQNKIAIVYETMWNSTEKMARKILEGIISENLEAKLFDVTKNDRTDIAAYMLDAKGWVFGSSTHDSEMLSVIAGFLYFLKDSKAKGRKAFAFGSYGWSGEAIKNIENILSKTAEFLPSLKFVYNPSEAELQECFNAGKNFAKKLKE